MAATYIPRAKQLDVVAGYVPGLQHVPNPAAAALPSIDQPPQQQTAQQAIHEGTASASGALNPTEDLSDTGGNGTNSKIRCEGASRSSSSYNIRKQQEEAFRSSHSPFKPVPVRTAAIDEMMQEAPATNSRLTQVCGWRCGGWQLVPERLSGTMKIRSR